MLAGHLPDTLTYTGRQYQWFPTVPHEGVLVLRQRRHTGGAEDAAVYGVEEVVRGQDSPERVFLLLNVTDDEVEPYEVVVRGGEAIACTCQAARCKVPVCKHRDAVVAILNTLSGELT